MKQRSWTAEMSRSFEASKDTGNRSKQSPEHHSQGSIVEGVCFRLTSRHPNQIEVVGGMQAAFQMLGSSSALSRES